MGCCFWLSTVTNTCLNVWLCHRDTRQMAMCDIQGENTWRESVRCVEVLHIPSVLLIDGAASDESELDVTRHFLFIKNSCKRDREQMCCSASCFCCSLFSVIQLQNTNEEPSPNAFLSVIQEIRANKCFF